MKKADLINALKVMRHIIFTAKLAYEPADKMIEYLNTNSLYTDQDIEEAFISGFMANVKSLDEIKDGTLKNAYDTFKFQSYLDRFGNKAALKGEGK